MLVIFQRVEIRHFYTYASFLLYSIRKSINWRYTSSFGSYDILPSGYLYRDVFDNYDTRSEYMNKMFFVAAFLGATLIPTRYTLVVEVA